MYWGMLNPFINWNKIQIISPFLVNNEFFTDFNDKAVNAVIIF